MSMVIPSDAQAVPFLGNNFALELKTGAGKKVETFFTGASGLGFEVEVVPIASAQKDNQEFKRPGVAKYESITLKRPLTGDKTFYEWIDTVRKGEVKSYRADGAIVLYSPDGNTDIARWTFTNAFPSKWSLTDPTADKADPLTEELVLAIEGLKRDK